MPLGNPDSHEPHEDAVKRNGEDGSRVDAESSVRYRQVESAPTTRIGVSILDNDDITEAAASEPGPSIATNKECSTDPLAPDEASGSTTHAPVADLGTRDLSKPPTSLMGPSFNRDLAILDMQLENLLLTCDDQVESSEDDQDQSDLEAESLLGIPESSQHTLGDVDRKQSDFETGDVLHFLAPYFRQATGNGSQTPDTRSNESQPDHGRRAKSSETSNGKRAHPDDSSLDPPEEDDDTGKRPRRTPDSESQGDSSRAPHGSVKIPCFVDECHGKDAHFSELIPQASEDV
ncbi:hypothetical protein LTR85_000637 [Meristemomyces frigidus]|nr:hypothetical protein LTR85_000637 [Meristemomyces frigidus]